MVQETIKVVKEAESKAAQILKEAGDEAEALREKAKQEAETLKEQAVLNVQEKVYEARRASEAEEQSASSTFAKETEGEIAALRQKASEKEAQAIEQVIANLY